MGKQKNGEKERKQKGKETFLEREMKRKARALTPSRPYSMARKLDRATQWHENEPSWRIFGDDTKLGWPTFETLAQFDEAHPEFKETNPRGIIGENDSEDAEEFVREETKIETGGKGRNRQGRFEAAADEIDSIEEIFFTVTRFPEVNDGRTMRRGDDKEEEGKEKKARKQKSKLVMMMKKWNSNVTKNMGKMKNKKKKNKKWNSKKTKNMSEEMKKKRNQKSNRKL